MTHELLCDKCKKHIGYIDPISQVGDLIYCMECGKEEFEGEIADSKAW